MKRQSFYIGAKALISRGDELLIVKEKVKGRWELPGGRIDAGQSIEDALEREVDEELGLTYKAMGRLVHAGLGDFPVENGHRLCMLFYDVRVEPFDAIKLSDEHTEAEWISESGITTLDTFTSDRAAMNSYFANMESR